MLSCVRTHGRTTHIREGLWSDKSLSPGPCRVERLLIALLVRGLPTINTGGLQHTRPIGLVPCSDKKMQHKNREEAFKQKLNVFEDREGINYETINRAHSAFLGFTLTGITTKYEELNCLCPSDVGVLYIPRYPEICQEYLSKPLQKLRTSATLYFPQILNLFVRLIKRRNARLNSGWLFQNRRFCPNQGETRFRRLRLYRESLQEQTLCSTHSTTSSPPSSQRSPKSLTGSPVSAMSPPRRPAHPSDGVPGGEVSEVSHYALAVSTCKMRQRPCRLETTAGLQTSAGLG